MVFVEHLKRGLRIFFTALMRWVIEGATSDQKKALSVISRSF